MTSIDLLPDDAESLKRLLLAREEELVTARAGQAAADEIAAEHRGGPGQTGAVEHLDISVERLLGG